MISERVDAAAFGILRATLAPEERAQADRFLRESDRTVYTAAHALLRVMLSAHVTHPARFRTNEWGKPDLDAAPSNLRFNLTHTRGLAACAITCDGEIGVDAEALDRTIEVMPLAETHFAASESAYLRRVPEASRVNDFFRIWTLKEAFIKAVGRGLSMPLDEFAFTLDPITFSGNPGLGLAAEEWYFRSLSLGSLYHLAVAVHHVPCSRIALCHRLVTLDEFVPLALRVHCGEDPRCG